MLKARNSVFSIIGVIPQGRALNPSLRRRTPGNKTTSYAFAGAESVGRPKITGNLLILSFLLAWFGGTSFAQSGKSVAYYYSSDSLRITADEYVISDTLPYLVIIHEQGSSRGEFTGIVDRFQKMNFNCLVPDVRNGGNANFLGNETAKRCRRERRSRSTSSVEEDISASVEYASGKSGKQVILLGAGSNGSLVLKAAKEQEIIRAAIALSPGEFFYPYFSVEDTISGIRKPLLIISSKVELPYMQQMVSNVSDEYKTVYAPKDSEGARGTRALHSSNPSSADYWLAVLLFFKDLQ
ncbi:MAG: dienelactone hydrolase family protein [Bacteroidales bacterium]